MYINTLQLLNTSIAMPVSSKAPAYKTMIQATSGRGKFRKNTMEEKKAMRNSRRRKQRQSRKLVKQQCKQLRKTVEETSAQLKSQEKRLTTLKCMARTFWERWRWETERRKEALLMSRPHVQRIVSKHSEAKALSEIDPALLIHPTLHGEQKECYLGRGSFGIVRLMVYRTMHVAVKYLHIHALKEDVQHEAEMTAALCHPFLPYFFGLCSKTQPYRIVLQFHGFLEASPLSLTVRRELDKRVCKLQNLDWISAIAQLLDAVEYLHTEAEILHNDITTTNILLGPSIKSDQCTLATCGKYQILLIDFGKATGCKCGKMLHLTSQDRLQYHKKFPQVAPEVVDGIYRQSTYSDIYSVGGVLYQVCESGSITEKSCQRSVLNLSEQCRLACYYKRVTARQALLQLQRDIPELP